MCGGKGSEDVEFVCRFGGGESFHLFCVVCLLKLGLKCVIRAWLRQTRADCFHLMHEAASSLSMAEVTEM